MDIIERAARALAKKANEPDWDSMYEGQKAQYFHRVRSVLSALREPDEGMIEAGREMTPYPRTIWQAMIDAALKG